MSAYAVGKSVIQVETGVLVFMKILLGYDAKGFGADLTLEDMVPLDVIRGSC
jgi:hypothetical protein